MSGQRMNLNRQCIIRISRYQSALERLKSLGFVKVFSVNLADAGGVSASMVRKDFSMFGITGNKRGGYNVDKLLARIREILGKNDLTKVVIVGSGNIAGALSRYQGFDSGGIKIVAAFDIDPSKYAATESVPVYPMDDFRSFVKDNEIKIGILAVPHTAAHHVSELMVSAGIKGILNFAPIQLRVPEKVVINNVNLEVEFENLIYFVNVNEKTNGLI